MPHAVDGSEIRAVHWELNSHDARGGFGVSIPRWFASPKKMPVLGMR